MCDLDGVVYRGDRAIPGAAEAIRRLTAGGRRIVFCTNNSRWTMAQYAEKLRAMDVEVAADQILTSGGVTAEVLAERGYKGARAVVVGGDGIRDALTSAGIDIVEDPKAAVDVVVVGWDPDFHFADMRRAATAARSGAVFVATNSDATFPAEDGHLWPGAGAILASIETAAGREAEVMGKPHDAMMDAAARRLAGASQIAVVGDRPETDLAGGVARGWTTILVLTGVTAREQLGSIAPVPDVVAEDLAEVAARMG